MYTENELLDAPTRKIEKLPFAIVSFEKYFFPIIFVIQYLSLLQLMTAHGFEGIIGFAVGGSLLFLTGIWQVVVGLLKFVANTQHKGYQIYLILAAADLIAIFLSVAADVILIAFVFTFVTSHMLAWYYWWMASTDSKIRQAALG